MTKTKKQRESERVRQSRVEAKRALGDRVICQRCGATIETYAEVCSAPLDDPCEGFRAYDDALAKAYEAPA